MVNEPLPDASMETSCDGLTVIVFEVPGETCTLICRLKLTINPQYISPR